MAKYSKRSQQKVERSMHEMKRGRLKSGRSGKKVTNPKQAIAIGLSEAREEGARVPNKRGARKGAKKGAKKAGARKVGAKKRAGRPVKRSGAKKSAARKRTGGAKKRSGARKSAVKKKAGSKKRGRKRRSS